jgi:hypothetical protein
LPHQIKQGTCTLSGQNIPELKRNCFILTKIVCLVGNRCNS